MECTVFGGSGEVGGNQIRIRSEGQDLWLDFGLPFGRYGLYFEEYLKPRTAAVLADLLHTGLAPRVGIYRDDLQSLAERRLGDLGLERPSERVRVFISHPHLDHCGLLGLLRPDVEICLSAEAAAVLRSLQETGSQFPTQDLLWFRYRGDEGRLSKDDAVRPLAVAGDISGLVRFHQEVVAYREAESKGASLPPYPLLQPSDQSHFTIDHSTPGATGWALQVEGDTIVYPGDFRLHGSRSQLMLEEARQLRSSARGRVLLFLEGTRFEPDKPLAQPFTEADVYHQFREVVARAEGELVVIDFAARNVERLLTAWAVARDTGRELVVLHKDAYLLLSLAEVMGVALAGGSPVTVAEACNSALVYRKARVSQYIWERFVESRFKAVEFPAIKAHPGRYILCISFFDVAELIDIVAGGGIRGVYIYSTSEPHTEEQRIDLERLRNWLHLLGLRLVGDPDEEASHHEPYHVSGHASPNDLVRLAEVFQPDAVVVVHAGHPREYAAFLRERLPQVQVVVPQFGRSFTL
ncbi:MAG: hypothetical protein ACE5IZ_02430 [Dehalococcoidia bacterium]